MVSWLNSGVRIQRLRVRSGGAPIVTRVRAERALSGAVRRPESLPPQAVLCIRRLTDPRPGLLPLEAGNDVPAAWSRAVAARVNDAAARAVRPCIEAVTSDAEAVLFADRAELLACLAIDACERRLGSRWWWQSIIGDASRVWRVADVWRTEPHAIAASLELLATRNRAVAFVRGLSADDVQHLIAAMLPAHGFAAGSPGHPGVLMPSVPRSETPGGATAGREAVARHASSASSSPDRCPWHAWAPEASSSRDLRADQRRLLGLALAIRRAPSVRLSAAFVTAALEWEESPESTDAQTPVVAHGDDLLTAGYQPRPVRPVPIGPADDVLPARSTGIDLDLKIGPDALAAGPLSDDHSAGVREAGQPQRPSEHSIASTPVETRPVHAPALAAEVRTECGGVLFLLNLGIALGLYGDFTTPRQPGIALSIWDFVTIAGRRLAGPDTSEDPLWSLLAELAHRDPQDAPGTGFEPPVDWRVSQDWLRPFAHHQGPWRWSAASGRLLVRHPAGFIVVDVLRSASESAGDQARREVDALVADSMPPLRSDGRHPRLGAASRPLDRWIDRVMSYAGARLVAAMPGRTRGSAGRLLCRLPASVLLTPAHLHAVFSLDALPIEVRMSGLDRDPGWIPAAGRRVTFSFE